MTHGAALLLPVMQSELNAIGERAGLIHLRGLDLEVAVPSDAPARTGRDLALLTVAAVTVAAAVTLRVMSR